MQKSFAQKLAKLLSVILVILFYCLVIMVSARGSHVTNHGIDSDDDHDMKSDETSLSVSSRKQLKPLHRATEYRLVTASQELEMELAAGNYNKSNMGLLWSQQQQPFQLCLACKCCMSAAEAEPSNCTSLPCCFVIDCQLPNKPYGVCAFVPKTCNCTSCTTPLH